LRAAIEAGWQVWGLSSMGAIRAAEMRSLGMRGFGAVYQRFVDDPRFRDDEVALLHEPSPPYRTFSEPLVHVRAGLEALGREGLAAADAERILAALYPLWFGDRTAARIHQAAAAVIGDGAATAWLARFDEFQRKSQDLAGFLEGPGGAGRPPGVE
jgi:hypothetical protein